MRIYLAFALALAGAGCEQATEQVPDRQAAVHLEVSNLPSLSSGHYQLWANILEFNKSGSVHAPLHSEIVSLGEFTVGTDGSPTGLTGNPATFHVPADRDPQLIDDLLITVQAEDPLGKLAHEEPGPAILGGKMTGDAHRGIANMRIDYPGALHYELSSATGKCTITSTTSSNPADSNSGVWFFEKSGTTEASLKNLPGLTGGWRYEGWVIEPSLPPKFYSTGRFTRADSMDSDGAGPGRGPGVAPNFPGQDFLTGTPLRPDLRTYRFLVTIEPEPDNSPDPFFLTLFSSASSQNHSISHAEIFAVNLANRFAEAIISARVVVER